ncbi:NADPH:quinone reductase [Actinomadura sp. BRA 177]|uniref:NADPH:quinone reductase n=1 Tax=Actinomadura sp. BRA 177 TaxID=2745202 RepID=UPI002814F71E|nr:NADPH:quinone reductase [Actinomadura sp. BRA 177]
MNPVDAFVRSGTYRTPVPMPLIVGRDLVGTVTGTGSGARGFGLGDRVWCNSMGHEGRQGTTAQFASVPAERLYRLPDGTHPETAVAVAQPAATAYLGWFVHGGLQPGRTVFVGGGAGNIGSAAIAMAALAGARVIASAHPNDHARCRAAGADTVLDYRDPHLPDRLTEHAPQGIEVYWETSGHHDFAAVDQVAAAGCRVLVTASAPDTPPVPLPHLYTRDVTLPGFVISRASATDLADAASLINHMLARGLLTAQIADRLPLAQTAEAHRRIEEGQVKGRLLITVHYRSGTRP